MPAKIDPDKVRHIAHLARLKLTDEEISRFGAQLGGILEYVEKLNEVDVAGVEPTAHPLDVCNVLAEDVPVAPIGVQKALANAPSPVPPYFKVPKVLDQETA
jgi:aspartyl-tRNA(Asn)/glutamyl-tRNA(Gln) amidotransferase subunit C